MKSLKTSKLLSIGSLNLKELAIKGSRYDKESQITFDETLKTIKKLTDNNFEFSRMDNNINNTNYIQDLINSITMFQKYKNSNPVIFLTPEKYNLLINKTNCKNLKDIHKEIITKSNLTKFTIKIIGHDETKNSTRTLRTILRSIYKVGPDFRRVKEIFNFNSTK